MLLLNFTVPDTVSKIGISEGSDGSQFPGETFSICAGSTVLFLILKLYFSGDGDKMLKEIFVASPTYLGTGLLGCIR